MYQVQMGLYQIIKRPSLEGLGYAVTEPSLYYGVSPYEPRTYITPVAPSEEGGFWSSVWDWIKENKYYLLQAAARLVDLYAQYKQFQSVAPNSPQAERVRQQFRQEVDRLIRVLPPLTPDQKRALINQILAQAPPEDRAALAAELEARIPVKTPPPTPRATAAGMPGWMWLALGAGALMLLRK